MRFSGRVALLLVCCAELHAQSVNSLTADEKAQGWQLLFDGKDLNGRMSGTAIKLPPTTIILSSS